MANGILFMKIQLNGEQCHRLLLPATLKTQVLHTTHDSMGHHGRTRKDAATLSSPMLLAKDGEGCGGLLQAAPEMCCVEGEESEVNHFVSQKTTRSSGYRLHCIGASQFGHRECNGSNPLFTMFTQVVPTKDQKARTVAKVLMKDRSVPFAVLLRIRSDQARNFESELATCNLRHHQKSHYSMSPSGECAGRAVQSNITQSTENFVQRT